MADEIQITAQLSISKNSVVASGSVAEALDLVTNHNFAENIQTISSSTTGAPVEVGDCTYPLWLFIKNLDDPTNVASNPVDIFQNGATATVLIGRLHPGMAFLFHPTATVGVKLVTGSTPVDIAVIATEHD